MTRRTALRAFAGAGTALLAASTVVRVAARSTDSLIVNTAGARLRSGPGTGYSILASLAKGTEVRYLADGGSANGYRWSKVRVLVTGQEGYVAADLLSAPDAGTPPPTDPRIIGTATTTANVNLRSGPSTGNTVLRVVPAGTTVQISDTVQNGFRYVNYDGLAGWIADQYLGSVNQPSGETAVTTAPLNLRAEPSTSARILLVMPSGALVQLLSGTAPGWRQVSYKGTVGWAATNYLN
jgi:uncharacterized protein YgiM (DUF1202 family)